MIGGDRVLDANRGRLAALKHFRAFLLGAIQIHAGVFFVAQDIVDLRILDRLPTLAADPGSLHFIDQCGEADAIRCAVEHAAHIDSLEFVDHIFLIYDIIAKGWNAAIVHGLHEKREESVRRH